MSPVLESLIKYAQKRARAEGLLQKFVRIKARVLSAQEAIGNPEKYDFPLLKGKEKIVEADFEGHLGHAFSDMYGGFEGTLKEMLELPASNNYRRALQIAAINALVRYWGLAENTVHCRDSQPQICAGKAVAYIRQVYPGVAKIALVGYQPAFLDALSQNFQIRVLDLDSDNIGCVKFGQRVLDGNKAMANTFDWADIILATGSTLVNDSIDSVLKTAEDKVVLFYGVTISGAACLLGLNRVCFSGET